jgi:hypothetical protein
MIKVINKYKAKPLELAFSTSIMRGTLLGNPFVLGPGGDRAEVIEKYRQWLWRQINVVPAVMEELIKLAQLHLAGGSVYLCCCCKPQACHGDIVKKAIEWVSEQISNQERNDIAGTGHRLLEDRDSSQGEDVRHPPADVPEG